jgi:SAM-dependent methyltransferase
MRARLKRYSRKLKNAIWEWRLNVRTRGVDSDCLHPDSQGYETVSYPAIWAILDSLKLQPDDTVLDLGCGKGRVICCAARLNVQRVIGVEINPRHVRTAQENSRRLRGRKAKIDIFEGLAQEADISEGTAYFLFNPFGSSTLREVVARIEACAVRRSRPTRIAYVVPKWGDVLDGAGWLERYESWEPRPEIELDYPVHFWRSTAASLQPRAVD